MSKKLAFAVIVVLLAGAFCFGYLLRRHEFRTLSLELENHKVLVERLEGRIESVTYEKDLSELRVMAGQLYLEVSRENFGSAARLSTSFFDSVRGLAEKTQAPSLKVALDSILAQRDNITTEIARATQSARERTENLFLYTLAVAQPSE